MSHEAFVVIVLLLVISLIMVVLDGIIIMCNNCLKYNKTDFKSLTSYNFFKVYFNKRLSNQYSMFEILRKNCIDGHILANVVVRDSQQEEIVLDLVMIDKHGISIFFMEKISGRIVGNANDAFWKKKILFFNKKIPNYYLVTNRKSEVLKNVLKITDTNQMTNYLIVNKNCNLKKIRIDTKNLKIIKKPYLNGAMAYETKSLYRVMTDAEIKAYSILLEKFTTLPVYKRDEMLKEVCNEENENSRNKKEDILNFQYYNQVRNYEDLKGIWNVLCECNNSGSLPTKVKKDEINSKDILLGKDADENNLPTAIAETMRKAEKDTKKLLPNAFFKSVVKGPMVIVRKDSEIIGFMALEVGSILKISSELGRVNLINTMCLKNKYIKQDIIKTLYKFVEERMPDDAKMPYIITKTTDDNKATIRLLESIGYKAKSIVDTRKEYGANTIYFSKKVKK